MMAEQREESIQGIGFVLLATLGWSLSGLFVRFMPELNSWQINCWRGYWMAAALVCYLVYTYGTDLPARIRAIPRFALWASAICFAIGTTFYVTSLTLTNVATVAVIGAISPLVTGLLSPWITGERPNLLAWISAAAAIVGSVYIGFHTNDDATSGNTHHVAGFFTSLGVPLTFALQTLLLRRYRALDMMPAIALGGFLAFLGCGILGIIFGDADSGGGFSVSLRSLGILMIMGPLQLSLPLIFYGIGARSVPAITLAILSMLDALLNPLWPWLFGYETPPVTSIYGGAIILGAVLLSIFGGHLHAYARRMSTR
jgi:drug/metabolite transporter (DMT)-like permease